MARPRTKWKVKCTGNGDTLMTIIVIFVFYILEYVFFRSVEIPKPIHIMSGLFFVSGYPAHLPPPRRKGKKKEQQIEEAPTKNKQPMKCIINF
jgi:hypothetical protein